MKNKKWFMFFSITFLSFWNFIDRDDYGKYNNVNKNALFIYKVNLYILFFELYKLDSA